MRSYILVFALTWGVVTAVACVLTVKEIIHINKKKGKK